MKILQINCVYKVGSTGKIVDCIGSALRDKGHEVFACYGIGKSSNDQYAKKICYNLEHKFNALVSRIRKVPYGGIYLSNHKLYKIIYHYQPDIVHLHCVNANTVNVYKLLEFLARNNLKTVLTLHAEIFHTAGCEHAYDCVKFKTFCHQCDLFKTKLELLLGDRAYQSWKMMKSSIEKFDNNSIVISAVSPWLAHRASQSSIMSNLRIKYVPNGVDTFVFHYRHSQCLIDRGKYKKIILFVTAYYGHELNGLKGGHFLPQLASLLPDYMFLVVASKVSNHLNYISPNIRIRGSVTNQDELAQLYSEADLTVILSKREAFSMVTAESLCCGTPVIGFKAGGPETIAIEEYCKFVEYGNINVLANAIECTLSQKVNKIEISARAQEVYSKENMSEQYLSIYNQLLV